jgi:hypothetical protein
MNESRENTANPRTRRGPVSAELRKLGRLAVLAVGGAQFLDLAWREDEERRGARAGYRPAAGARPLSETELAELIERAIPRRSIGGRAPVNRLSHRVY